MIPRRFLLPSLLLALSLGCADPESGAPARTPLVVLAASSLREAFTAIAEDFEREHADVTVTFNFAGSQELSTQLEHGAAADVLASADMLQMERASRRAVTPRVFAHNELVIVLSRQGAVRVRSLADLPKLDRIVLGAPEVPVGRYTAQVLDRASTRFGDDFRSRVEGRVVSRELNVRQVLAKVTLGEAQAALVYRTDAIRSESSGRVVTIPADLNVLAEYPIAVIADAPHPDAARAFVNWVLSPRGQRALLEAGFIPLYSVGER